MHMKVALSSIGKHSSVAVAAISAEFAVYSSIAGGLGPDDVGSMNDFNQAIASSIVLDIQGSHHPSVSILSRHELLV